MDVVLWVFVGLLVVAVVAAWSLILQLLRQQGRLLLRLEALEQGAALPPGAAANGAPQRPEGIAPATEFPSFRLPDLAGRDVALEDLRGRRVLLVHWDPRCGFCGKIAPDLATLQGDLRKRNTELVLVSYRDPDENRLFAEERGLDCAVLLQRDAETIAGFARMGTPVAYLLDERGRVAKPVAVGANEVPELAEHAAGKRKRLTSERSLAESRIEREGLRPGTPAPAFSLPDLAGRTISLDDYRGRGVLLVFSDPHCGPCNHLGPDLARLHEDHGDNGVAFLMVSRGGVDENRRKAEEHGIDFPVVIQPGWKLSKEYGIFATPVAFLIDEHGVIAREVARGAPEIVRLAHEAVAVREEAPLA